MEVRFFPSLALVPLKVRSERPQGSSPTFHPGEQLIAKVLAQVAPGRLLLEIGGHKLMAETELNFSAGTSLRLEVVQVQPKIQLRIIADLSPMTSTVPALRRALPQQIPLDQALRSLQEALGRPNLAPPVRTQIEALLNSLPDRIALAQPDKLALSLRLSGLFTEALAATTVEKSPVETDLKTRLLELAASIKTALAHAATSVSPAPTPSKSPTAFTAEQETLTDESTISEKSDLLPELAEKISGALARIVVDQIASLPKPETQALSWHLEIPFRDGERLESLNLTIAGERRAKGDLGETLPWTVELEMAPPGLGRIRVKLVLQGEKISSYFWGERDTTICLLERHLDTLARRFRAAGLEPNYLHAVDKLRSGPIKPVATGPLLDEKI